MTATGQRQHYLLGKQIARDYKVIFDGIERYKDIEVISTFYNRTFHSAQSLLAGLLPKENVFDYQFPSYLDQRYFPEIKLDENLIPEEEMKVAYKGDYYPIRIQTAANKNDQLLATNKYAECNKDFVEEEKKEKIRVQKLGEENFEKDVTKVLGDLELKFDKNSENFTWFEKCYKLGELITTEIFANPASEFLTRYKSDLVYRRVKNCYSIGVKFI